MTTTPAGRRKTTSEKSARRPKRDRRQRFVLPADVRPLLKTYDIRKLKWRREADRYAIVREILSRGSRPALSWLGNVLPRAEQKALVRKYRGAGLNERDRARVRRRLGLTTRDLPARPFLGFSWTRRD